MTGLEDHIEASALTRRSCLLVKPSSDFAEAASGDADQVMFDLEDGCPAADKVDSRARVGAALNSAMFDGKVRTVRVNDVTTHWCYRDIVDVVTAAAAHLDALVIPKVAHASHVHFVDHLLTQLEFELGLKQQIALEIMLESAEGLTRLREIACASDRTAALVFGPHDYAVSLGYENFEWGATVMTQSGFQLGWAMHEIANHAHARGIHAIDGIARPYDQADYRASCDEALLIGFDGKWCLNADHVAVANEAWTPSEAVYRTAEQFLAGQSDSASYGSRPDPAMRDMALRLAARGRRAGLSAES